VSQGARRPAAALAVASLALAGAASLAAGSWIPAKARAARWLIERAWTRARSGESHPRPWSWADTWPVARLEAPRLDVDLLVLEGATGSSLAFGPGHWSGSALPGAPGHSVVAGHRDTHFAFLERIRPGDVLRVTRTSGEVVAYRVGSARVVHERDSAPLRAIGGRSLALVTCFPFHALAPGGDLRFVVTAVDASPARRGAPILGRDGDPTGAALRDP